MSSQAVAGQVTAQTAHKGVLLKLIIFTVSLAVVPLTSYFGSKKYIWDGNSNYAAITAIVAANIVLIAYIVTSILEDQASQDSAAKGKLQPSESKKAR
ncbi:hypothetical protein FIBSPDRAFT_1050300 [Athelia psychrophila]|uniref:Vacuolar ATPase assembly integral membrane protein VMA21 n=1 Tax=Athelia psychrophila TaxID=1759441 RepID=A0A167XFJ7_9AGAM|nr:hypothetical protein FIBSPDRAFT_1053162 [Fibularhizoctonia sp. CBS 109695]KZP12140.1 hypothetical protein FIBSPDRAFT_1050300 [Fibularhizoctonia sp. CBS 109695]